MKILSLIILLVSFIFVSCGVDNTLRSRNTKTLSSALSQAPVVMQTPLEFVGQWSANSQDGVIVLSINTNGTATFNYPNLQKSYTQGLRIQDGIYYINDALNKTWKSLQVVNGNLQLTADGITQVFVRGI